MKKILGFLFWGAVFGLMLLGIDQFLLRTSLTVPGLRQGQTFYRDFRQRLLHLSSLPAEKGKSPAPKPAPSSPPKREKESSPTPLVYVYADESGNLQFVESLAQVPERWRATAKPLQP